MPDNATSAGSGLSVTWQGLAAVPQLLTDTREGVATLTTLLSTPAAAAATGSPPASAAIIALGVELAVFLAETVKAIDADVDAIVHTARTYQATEGDVTAATAAVLGVLIELTSPSGPALTSGSGGTTGGTSSSTTPAVRPNGRRDRVATTTGGTR